MFRLTITLMALALYAPLGVVADTAAVSGQKAVLVTGASTGIGRKVTEQLAANGYFVYAGARKEIDLADLGRLKNVQPVRLDVTKQEDIDAAVATITKAGRGLFGLVNNAGPECRSVSGTDHPVLSNQHARKYRRLCARRAPIPISRVSRARLHSWRAAPNRLRRARESAVFHPAAVR